MAHGITPFLMFEGAAEEATRFCVSLFARSEVKQIEHDKSGEMGPEGSVKRAGFTLAGQAVICTDSPARHASTFTPAVPLFVECEDEAEFDNAFARLADGGKLPMSPDNYGFSRKLGWLIDRFGVSWQTYPS
jgi:predicted 3-demethylubiquinone-9 3-methyltransferase (glyoxalase superfamily)